MGGMQMGGMPGGMQMGGPMNMGMGAGMPGKALVTLYTNPFTESNSVEQVLVSQACSRISIQPSSHRTKQPEETGKILMEQNDLAQSNCGRPPLPGKCCCIRDGPGCAVSRLRLKGVIWSWGIGGECSSGIERHICARFFNLKSVPTFSISTESIRSASNAEGGSTLDSTHYNFCLYHVSHIVLQRIGVSRHKPPGFDPICL